MSDIVNQSKKLHNGILEIDPEAFTTETQRHGGKNDH